MSLRDHLRVDPDSPGVAVPPPLIFLAAMAAGHLLIGGGWDAVLPPIAEPWRWCGGGSALLAGCALMAPAARAFLRAGTGLPPNRPATRLVTTGLYRLGRNPIYLGMALAALGIAVLVASPGALAGALAAILIVDRWVIGREEAYLAKKFGADYAAYRARVRRWL